MKDYSNYMGGTNISLERLKELGVTASIDGTTYPIENWFKEIEIFESLEIGKSKVFVPYGGTEKHGTLVGIEWDKHIFKDYNHTDETEDWWFFEPVLLVKVEGKEGNFFVYEYSYYEENKEVVYVNKIELQLAEAFTPKGRSLGMINYFQFNDLCIQIKDNELEGYYLIFDERKHIIDKDGMLTRWTEGLFDLQTIQLNYLLDI